MVCGCAVSIGQIVATAYGHGVGFDFSILWAAARSRVPYTPDPYAPFVYPPTALIWIQPLRLLSLWPALLVWSVASVASFFSVTRRPVLFASPILVQGLLFGQPTLLLASLILNRSRMRGILIGVAFSLKPQMLFLAPLVFLARRDWRTLFGMGTGAAISVLVSIVVFGAQSWVDWIGSLPHLRQVMDHRHLWWMTITPYGFGSRLGFNPWLFWIAGTTVALVTAVRSRSDPIFIAVLVSILATPYAYAQDLIALLPICFRRLETSRSSERIFLALIFSAALLPVALFVVAIQEAFRSVTCRSSEQYPSSEHFVPATEVKRTVRSAQRGRD